MADIRDALGERLGVGRETEKEEGSERRPTRQKAPGNTREALETLRKYVGSLVGILSDKEPEVAEGLEEILTRVEDLLSLVGGTTRNNKRSPKGEVLSEEQIESVLGR